MPPRDFVDRTLAAVLRERAAADRHWVARTWVRALAIAAVLVSGAAAAWTVYCRSRALLVSRESLVVPSQLAVMPLPPAPARALSSVSDRPADPPRHPPPVTPKPLERRVIPAPSATLSADVDAGRKVYVPLCNCHDSICDCGQQF
jgi:hypothetical protein